MNISNEDLVREIKIRIESGNISVSGVKMFEWGFAKPVAVRLKVGLEDGGTLTSFINVKDWYLGERLED